MIYRQADRAATLTQGDILDDCPILLENLIKEGKRVARIRIPFREHLAQHFSTTYARLGFQNRIHRKPDGQLPAYPNGDLLCRRPANLGVIVGLGEPSGV